MTKEEKTDRRIVFIEEPVNQCTPQSQCQSTPVCSMVFESSTMVLAGDCLNNNRKISCDIICCDTSMQCSYSSANVTLTVKGTENVQLYYT